jgi:hypothetical protein
LNVSNVRGTSCRLAPRASVATNVATRPLPTVASASPNAISAIA